MLPAIGRAALILAFCVAFMQALLPFARLIKMSHIGARSARQLHWVVLGCLLLAFALLGQAFINNDFSVNYVAAHSNTHLPWYYRFCAIWGGHEGSLLLWVILLSIWTCLFSCFDQAFHKQTLTRIYGVIAVITVGFLGFLLLTSNPFAQTFNHIPQQGRDLNPLLQDPGLISHPPILYMGYVGFALVFAMAMAALWQGRFDRSWARMLRPYALLAWCFLTLGVVLGSWWAYRELGWGGWWYWDPVENASLMPWLTATALIHCLVATAKRQAFPAWCLLLATVTFILSLLGTFLVRSGVLISVHTFAVDPARGVYILVFLAFVAVMSLALFGWRGPSLRGYVRFGYLARDSLLLTNNALLMVMMLTVLLGTIYPIIIEAMGWGKIAVGAPYYNSVFIPLVMPFLAMMTLSPYSRWRTTPWSCYYQKLRWSLLLGVIATFLTVWWWPSLMGWRMLMGLGLGYWLIGATLFSLFDYGSGFKWPPVKLTLRQWAMMTAHLGVGLVTLGVVFAATQSIERHVQMVPGDKVELGAYKLRLARTRGVIGSNYHGIRADLALYQGGQWLNQLQPEVRIYPASGSRLPKTAIVPGFFQDIYVALGQPVGHHGWSMRLYVKPLVRWIWLGGVLIAIGGLLALIAHIKAQWRTS